MRKYLWLAFGLLVGLPLLAFAALFLLVNPQKFTPLLTSKLNQALERSTSVDKLDLQFFPPGFVATNLTISEDPAFSTAPFLKAQSIEIRPAILPLIRGQLEIESMHIIQPDVQLIQNSSGAWNVSSLGGRSKADKSRNLKLARLHIENARLGLTRKGSPREQYSDISAELRDYAEGQPFSMKLSALMPSGKLISADGRITTTSDSTAIEKMTLTLASLKGTIDGEWSSTSMNLRLNIPKSPIADAAPLFLPQGVNVKGDIVVAITAQGSPQKPSLNGRIDIAGFEVSGGGIRQPVRTGKLGLALTPERITLEPAAISSGATQLQAFGVITNYATAPQLEATMITPGAEISELLAIAKAYGMSSADPKDVTGQAKLQIRAHGPLNAKTPLSFAGNGALRNAVLRLPTLTKPLEIAGTDFRFEANSAVLTGIAAKLGTSNISGDCRISNFSRPVVDFNLSSDRIVIDEVRGLFKDDPKQAGGSPARVTASGTLKAAAVQVAELTLTQLTATANYRDGHLVLNPLSASLYGGRHSGSMDIDMRPAKPVYSINSRLERIESASLLAAVTSLKGIVSGPMNTNLNLNFSPGEPVDLARSLNGRIHLNLAQGRIASFNLTNELGKLAQFLGFNSGEKFTQFTAITGDLELNNGQASTQNLKVDLANLTASITGKLNLADQSLDLKMVSLLDKRFSDQVGGNRIGGFMTAALSNSSGNLVIPARITGTFAKPLIAPDPAALAKLKLQSFSPKDPKQMMDSVNSVIDLFKKRKP